MKKIISILLTTIIVFSCAVVAVSGIALSAVTAEASTIELENGAKVEIAPFLYKSKLYQMEFPSIGSYSVKDKSVIGDYTISRELNDLSYSFTFPAGTTEIFCKCSLVKDSGWRGFTINSTDNPNYWEKDEDGNIDYTKPLTFRRGEVIAEQDEYGVLYRDFLMNSDCEGFRDYDKIYWKLEFFCNGELLTDYFEIKLYDYDSSEKFDLKAVNYNVYGLPFASIYGENVQENLRFSGKYLTENDFDIVAVQEDFNYHSDLVNNMSGYNYETCHSGGIPVGDGLSIFTKNMPIYNEVHVPWNESCGILSDGSDELTPKGFVYTVIDLGNGIYVDFYNLHADAYAGEGSIAARSSQYRQLAEFIKARSAEHDRPVIVTGDFNNHMHVHEDDGALYNTLYVECGLKDAWIEFHNNGDYFNLYKWHISGLPAWGNWDSVERFMYRGGGGVDIVVKDFKYVEVLNDNGKAVSDHSSAECDFTFIKTSDFVENTEELNVITASDNNIIKLLMCIIQDLIKIFSDIGNIGSLFEELFAV